MIKLLIDTDIGDDIDDAFAIALACASPECEIMGISTVFRNTAARAKQAAQLLETAGIKAPVFVGETTPLLQHFPLFNGENCNNPVETLPCQFDEGMNAFSTDGSAVDNIIRLANEHAGELVIVTLGAATNLARAIQRDHTICGKIKKVVMMGGWYTNFAPEWNVLCDPEALDIVFKSGLPVYAVGLDVTLQCGLESSLLDKFRSSAKPVNKLLTLWLDRWFEYFNFDKSVMHDPLALATTFNSNICRFSPCYVKVITEGEKRGAVQVSSTEQSGYSKIFAADTVDKQLFYGEIESRLL